MKGKNMKAEYDFLKGKRGTVTSPTGRTRISIYIDSDVLDGFRAQAEKAGTGYQAMINDVLRKHLVEAGQPLNNKPSPQARRQEAPERSEGRTTAPARTRAKSGTRR